MHTVLILTFANTPMPGRCVTCCTRIISCDPQNKDPKENLTPTAICGVCDLPIAREFKTQTTSVGYQGPGTMTPDQTSGAHSSLSCEFSPKTLPCWTQEGPPRTLENLWAPRGKQGPAVPSERTDHSVVAASAPREPGPVIPCPKAAIATTMPPGPQNQRKWPVPLAMKKSGA